MVPLSKRALPNGLESDEIDLAYLADHLDIRSLGLERFESLFDARLYFPPLKPHTEQSVEVEDRSAHGGDENAPPSLECSDRA